MASRTNALFESSLLEVGAQVNDDDESMTLDQFMAQSTTAKKRPKYTAGKQASSFDKALESFKERAFGTASSPSELVLAHARCHEYVYGSIPSDTRTQFTAATAAMRAFSAREFDGDADRTLAFIRWAWRREQRLKQWVLKEKRTNKTPMGWRQLISGKTVDAYRSEVLSKR